MIYDNEEQHCFYSPKNDDNGGRERVGMGILMARYLQKVKDDFLDSSLLKYVEYVKRELLDEETGEVFNDYMRDNSYFRLYNFPWMSLLFIELYTLYNSIDHLKVANKILNFFYAKGGGKFYAIEVPAAKIAESLEKENLINERNDLIALFKKHGDTIIDIGTAYPPHEVNYEQSIVAPAANLLIQLYMITGEKKYLDGAKTQMEVLELFNGSQPDYRLNEVSIRHWDGYWFGKRRMYGDTYPHYWSSLTGNAYNDFAKVLNDDRYANKARAPLRATLSLFMPDGSASCAFVYPVTVNGSPARHYDPYANDQDWGLYFMLRYMWEDKN